MIKIVANSDNIIIAYEEMTKEIDQIIFDEVKNLRSDLEDIGEKIRVTRNFKNGIMATRKTNYGWVIQMKAKYSSILWAGRRTIGGREYGSLGWYNGGAPMLEKMGNDITRRVNDVKR